MYSTITENVFLIVFFNLKQNKLSIYFNHINELCLSTPCEGTHMVCFLHAQPFYKALFFAITKIKWS